MDSNAYVESKTVSLINSVYTTKKITMKLTFSVGNRHFKNYVGLLEKLAEPSHSWKYFPIFLQPVLRRFVKLHISSQDII